MFYMYVLQSADPQAVFYVGSTGDLKRRFAEHNNGETPSPGIGSGVSYTMRRT